MINQIIILLVLFIVSSFILVFHSTNILMVLLTLEIHLLALNLMFISMSVYLDDLIGQVISLFIITIAGAESAIGIALIIAYYKIRGHINLFLKSSLRS